MLTNKHKAQLIIVMTFVLGVVVGAAGQYLFLQNTSSKPANANQEQIDEMARAVHLTPAQRNEVEQMLAESRQQYQVLREQMRPQFVAVRDATRKRIHSILPPEQQVLFEQWTRELDAKRQQKEKEQREKEQREKDAKAAASAATQSK